MEKQSELLIRSTLHDMANVLAGVQGILELSDPERPLSQRDRNRLEAVVEEGLATLVRARHLAMGTIPDGAAQDGADWRAQLADELKPMSTLFRCRFELPYDGGPGPDLWPGHLRSYLRAAIRHVLPYAQGGLLEIHTATEVEAWVIHLKPVSVLPEGLLAQPEDQPGDVCGRWAQTLGKRLDLALSWEAGGLTIRLPRT